MDDYRRRQIIDEAEEAWDGRFPLPDGQAKHVALILRDGGRVEAEVCPSQWFLLRLIETQADYSVRLTEKGRAALKGLKSHREQRAHNRRARAFPAGLTWRPFENLRALLPLRPYNGREIGHRIYRSCDDQC